MSNNQDNEVNGNNGDNQNTDYIVPNVNRNPKDHLISRLILNQTCTSILLDAIENYYEFRIISSLFEKCRTRINSYSIDRYV